MDDDNPLVNKNNSMVCLKYSETLEVDIDQAIPNNRTSLFCVQGMKVDILAMAPAVTNWSGLFVIAKEQLIQQQKEKVAVDI